MDPSILTDFVPYLAIGIPVFAVVMGIVVIVVVRVMMGQRKGLRARWAAGVYGVWTGADDSGSWDRQRAQRSLSDWYGAQDADGLEEVVDGLVAGRTSSVAWDVGRAADLLRIGVAAGYVSESDCWDKIEELAERLRSQYRSWEDYAAAFERGMHAWQDGSGVTDPGERGRVQRNLPVLRGKVWPKAAWNAEFD